MSGGSSPATQEARRAHEPMARMARARPVAPARRHPSIREVRPEAPMGAPQGRLDARRDPPLGETRRGRLERGQGRRLFRRVVDATGEAASAASSRRHARGLPGTGREDAEVDGQRAVSQGRRTDPRHRRITRAAGSVRGVRRLRPVAEGGASAQAELRQAAGCAQAVEVREMSRPLRAAGAGAEAFSCPRCGACGKSP